MAVFPTMSKHSTGPHFTRDLGFCYVIEAFQRPDTIMPTQPPPEALSGSNHPDASTGTISTNTNDWLCAHQQLGPLATKPRRRTHFSHRSSQALIDNDR